MTDQNPIELLQNDWQRAIDSDDANHNICTLATSENNQAHARVLILRDITENGLLLFTNASSPKWQQLGNSDGYEILLYWPSLDLQYRIRGGWSEYPRQQLEGAWHNKSYEAKMLDMFYQSHPEGAVIPGREYLLEKVAELKAQYPRSGEIPFPEQAKGIYFKADRIEYYRLSTTDRLHHRYLYQLSQGQWEMQTLSP